MNAKKAYLLIKFYIGILIKDMNDDVLSSLTIGITRGMTTETLAISVSELDYEKLIVEQAIRTHIDGYSIPISKTRFTVGHDVALFEICDDYHTDGDIVISSEQTYEGMLSFNTSNIGILMFNDKIVYCRGIEEC